MNLTIKEILQARHEGLFTKAEARTRIQGRRHQVADAQARVSRTRAFFMFDAPLHLVIRTVPANLSRSTGLAIC
jgi:hypothetical protein